MTIINLTPHDITVETASGERITFSRSGQIARVEMETVVVPSPVDDIPAVVTRPRGIVGLPEPQPNTIYLVSGVVLSALEAMGADRVDVVAPDTGPESAIRDEAGRIIAVRRLRVPMTTLGVES